LLEIRVMIQTESSRGRGIALKARILSRITAQPKLAWTPADFADLGPRAAVDMALARLAASGEIRRFARGLYDKPWINSLTGKPSAPDHQATIEAVARRDGLRYVLDGMTAANALGLTDAVPAKTVVHVESRLKARRLGKLAIEFKPAAGSKLVWAGRPAMRIVQALAWLKDTLPRDRDWVMPRIARLLEDQSPIREDLVAGFHLLPISTQELLRELLFPSAAEAAGSEMHERTNRRTRQGSRPTPSGQS